ncbi:hypothetical protein [Aeromicrobium sp.]|uniref:hypothetical protein n=1 Tax=Aeromicrobium sp. TaxID=1871063 RepID=UPI002FC790B2
MTIDTRDRATQLIALRKVQRRVAAIGFFAVAVHGIIGLAVVGNIVDGQGRHGDAILLTVMSGVLALITYGIVRTILQRGLWSPVWILIAITPTVIAATQLA